jgi:hypothetical protein
VQSLAFVHSSYAGTEASKGALSIADRRKGTVPNSRTYGSKLEKGLPGPLRHQPSPGVSVPPVSKTITQESQTAFPASIHYWGPAETEWGKGGMFDYQCKID